MPEEGEEEENKSNATDESEEYVVEVILAARPEGNGSWEFLIRWYGYDASEDTWEPEENLRDCQQLLDSFFSLWPGNPDFKPMKEIRPTKQWIREQQKRIRAEMKSSNSRKRALKPKSESPKSKKAPTARTTITSKPRQEVPGNHHVTRSPSPLPKNFIGKVTSLMFDAPGPANILPSPGKKRRVKSRFGSKLRSSSSDDSSSDPEPLAKRKRLKESISRLSFRKKSATARTYSPQTSTGAANFPPGPSRAASHSPSRSHSPDSLFSLDSPARRSSPPAASQELAIDASLSMMASEPSIEPISAVDLGLPPSKSAPDQISIHPTPSSELPATKLLPSNVPSTIPPPSLPPLVSNTEPSSKKGDSSSRETRRVTFQTIATDSASGPPMIVPYAKRTFVRPDPLQGIATKARIISKIPSLPRPLGRQGARRAFPPMHSTSLDSKAEAFLQGILSSMPASSLGQENDNRIYDDMFGIETNSRASTSGKRESISGTSTITKKITEDASKVTDPRRRMMTQIEKQHKCDIYLGKNPGLHVALIDVTSADVAAKIRLEHILRFQPSLKFSEIVPVAFCMPLVLQAFETVHVVRVLQNDSTQVTQFQTTCFWISRHNMMARAKIDVPGDIPGKIGSLLLLPSNAKKLLSQLSIPSNATSGEDQSNHLLLALLIPRSPPRAIKIHHSGLQTEGSPLQALRMSPDLLESCKGKQFAIVKNANSKHDGVYATILRLQLQKIGAVEVEAHNQKPQILFIHIDTPVKKILGLAYRRFCYPELRFIMFGRSGWVSPEMQGFKEVWPLGGVVTLTPQAIVENPLGVRDRIRRIARQPFYHVYITPLCLGWIYNGLRAGERIPTPASQVAQDILLELIDDGILALTSCPPAPWKDKESSVWLEQSLKIRHYILMGLTRKTEFYETEWSFPSGYTSDAVEALLKVCLEELAESELQEVEEVDYCIRCDLVDLQMLPVAQENWRRFVLLVGESGEAQALDQSKDGVEQVTVREFEFLRSRRSKLP